MTATDQRHGHRDSYDGDERRARILSSEEIGLIAAAAAKVALADLFEMFGADITTPQGRKDVQDNWNWLADTRRGTQFIRKSTGMAIIAAIIGGVSWAVSKAAAILWAAGKVGVP